MNRWVARLVGSNRWEIGATAVAVLADLAHRLVYDRLNAVFVGIMDEPALAGVGVLLGVYAAWCVALALIGGLSSPARRSRGRFSLPRLLFVYPSLGFGVILIVAVSHAAGLGSDASPLDPTAIQVALWGAIGLFFTHAVIALRDPTPRRAASGPAMLLRVTVIVLVAEVTLNLSSALWVTLMGAPDAGPIAFPDRVLTWATLSPIYLLFFAGPRFALHSRRFTVVAFASGVVLALSAVWSSIQFVRVF